MRPVHGRARVPVQPLLKKRPQEQAQPRHDLPALQLATAPVHDVPQHARTALPRPCPCREVHEGQGQRHRPDPDDAEEQARAHAVAPHRPGYDARCAGGPSTAAILHNLQRRRIMCYYRIWARHAFRVRDKRHLSPCTLLDLEAVFDLLLAARDVRHICVSVQLYTDALPLQWEPHLGGNLLRSLKRSLGSFQLQSGS